MLVLVTLVWYTYAAWWCWWLGGAFGHRGFVEYYALLAIPLAWGMERSLHWRWSVRLVFTLLLLLLMSINMSMTSDYEWAWSEPGWTWRKLIAEWKSLL